MQNRRERAQLIVSATFTADSLCDAAAFWSAWFSHAPDIVIAPYGQIHQALLNPSSQFRQNQDGANILCVRWVDLAAGAATPGAAYAKAAAELARALLSFKHVRPCLVIVCPQAAHRDAARAADDALAERIAQMAGIELLRGEQVFCDYGVHDPFDARADAIGHVPYNAEAFAALGAAIMRWRLAAARRPIKLIAVDCDNTLWSGVVGEDGVDGITFSTGQLALQRRLAAQADAGRIICLLSKNQERDVLDVFAQRPEMELPLASILAHRINWRAKPENLAELADAFGVGHDGIIFIDDSSIECAEMRARLPGVASVQFPKNPNAQRTFADHVWLFDLPPATGEDRRRLEMYRDSVNRDASLKSAVSFSEFMAGLELNVEIFLAQEEHLARLAQLTQRTNQFNAHLLRLDEAELRQSINQPHTHLYGVRVCDRFGNYGVVGAMRAHETGDGLEVDMFLLSCRALGRGVEHQMLAALGALGMDKDRRRLSMCFRDGPRNRPVKDFLETVFGETGRDGHEGDFIAATRNIATVQFDQRPPGETETHEIAPASARPSAMEQHDDVFEQIAAQLTTGRAIIAAMTEQRRERPDLASSFVAPAPGLEDDIAAIWREALNVSSVGVNDAFSDLGGKSIHLVRIHGALIDRLGCEIELVTLFQYSTVAQLARHLNGNRAHDDRQPNAYSAKQRAAKMRTARAGWLRRAETGAGTKAGTEKRAN